jgi:hypothetical protein
MKQEKLQTWNTYAFFKRNGYINYNYWIYHTALKLRIKNKGWDIIEWVIRKNGKKMGWKHLLNYRANDNFILMVEKNVNIYIDGQLDTYEKQERTEKYKKPKWCQYITR